jgi:hypothetical protein
VTISSEMNLFIVGVVLVAFVVLAPEGILGLVPPPAGPLTDGGAAARGAGSSSASAASPR